MACSRLFQETVDLSNAKAEPGSAPPSHRKPSVRAMGMDSTMRSKALKLGFVSVATVLISYSARVLGGKWRLPPDFLTVDFAAIPYEK